MTEIFKWQQCLQIKYLCVCSAESIVPDKLSFNDESLFVVHIRQNIKSHMIINLQFFHGEKVTNECLTIFTHWLKNFS